MKRVNSRRNLRLIQDTTYFVCRGNIDCTFVICSSQRLMQIRFVSGLTAEEENDLAPALLSAVTAILDRLPLAYTLRIETSGNEVFQHSQPARATPQSVETSPAIGRP